MDLYSSASYDILKQMKKIMICITMQIVLKESIWRAELKKKIYFSLLNVKYKATFTQKALLSNKQKKNQFKMGFSNTLKGLTP